ncbi:MAG TPA: lysylphosphatidylglycerol synthase transmembrane domain-containing protein [Mycobacteriales bacterium]|nr:lysylphosphatidylglycerol synthase transmembrane domain-containing protein [Mycobacteriales bacterium]HWB66405.1 lysylphosphatidylglycerol synthase transmembrane domain-containing protein [Mycobacteriales bacterium]
MRSRPIRTAAQLAALAVAVWLLVVPQLRGSAGSLRQLLDVDNSWLPVALCAELGSLAAYTFATRTMLARSVRPAYPKIVCVDLSAIALGHCVPDGGAAGTALAWRMLVDEGVPGGDAAFTKFAQGLASAVTLYTLLLGGLVAGGVVSGFTPWSVPLISLAATLVTAMFLACVAIRRPGARRRLDRGVRRLPWLGAAVADRAGSFYGAHLEAPVRNATREPRRLLSVAGWSAANWSLDALALWASLRACGAHVGLEALAVAFGIACFGTWLPITPSGLGLSEGLMIPAMIAGGSSRVAVALGVLTWRAIAYWMPIPLGATAYATHQIGRRVRRRRLEALPPLRPAIDLPAFADIAA